MAKAKARALPKRIRRTTGRDAPYVPKDEKRAELTQENLRKAALHLLELAVVYDSQNGEKGYGTYSYASADERLNTHARLRNVVQQLLEHQRQRDQDAQEVRAAMFAERVVEWIDSSDNVSTIVLALAQWDLPHRDGQENWREEAGLSKELVEYREQRRSGIKGVPPTVFADEWMGRVVGKGKDHIANLRATLTGRSRQKVGIKTKEAAQALANETGVAAPDLILYLLKALPQSSLESMGRWIGGAIVALATPDPPIAGGRVIAIAASTRRSGEPSD